MAIIVYLCQCRRTTLTRYPRLFFVMGVANGAHIPGKGNGRESFCREEIFFYTSSKSVEPHLLLVPLHYLFLS